MPLFLTMESRKSLTRRKCRKQISNMEMRVRIW